MRDPKSATTAEIGRRHSNDPQAFVAEMLSIADIFGTDLAAGDIVRTALAGFVAQLRTAPAVEVVATLLRAG